MSSKLSKSHQPLALAIALALGALSARAATITVTDGGDALGSGGCTLRDAVVSANTDNAGSSSCTAGSGADTIVFDAGLSPSTVTLSGTELSVTSPVTIDGGAAGWDIRANESTPGGYPVPDFSRVFSVSNATLALDHVHLSNGYGYDGGCIKASASSISLSNSTVSGCYTDYPSHSGNGGAIAVYGSTLTLNRSRVGTSIAGDSGGVIYARGSDITLRESSIDSGNSFYLGRGGVMALKSGSTLTLVDSVVSTGFARYGGLIELSYSSMTSVDSTLVGGYARNFDAGIAYAGYCGAIEATHASLTLVNSTVSGNFAYTYGGAICARSGSSVTLHNTIVSANSVGASGSDPDIFSDTYGMASTVSASYSLLGLALQSGFDANGNVFNDDPGLGPFGGNGGATKTWALKSDSPAIGNGSIPLAIYNGDPLNFDQRGIGFPRTLSGKVDIGAISTSRMIVSSWDCSKPNPESIELRIGSR